MQCKACKRESMCNLKHMGPYCKSCFCTVIEKRVRRHLRTAYKLKAKETLYVLMNESKESQVALYLIKSISKNIPLDIREINTKEEYNKELDENHNQTYAKIIIPFSATQIASDFLKHIMLKEKDIIKNPNEIYILEVLNNEEITTFANLKHITYTEEKQKNDFKKEDKFKKVIEQIEQQYPSSAFSILKSKEVLEHK